MYNELQMYKTSTKQYFFMVENISKCTISVHVLRGKFNWCLDDQMKNHHCDQFNVNIAFYTKNT